MFGLKSHAGALAAVLALLLAACGSETAERDRAPTYSIYRHAMDGAPSSLDPAQASNIYAKFLVVNLFDTLYRYKYLARPYELVPNLAEGMPQVSADGLIYTIRIKPGVHFIDEPSFPDGIGRAVRAKDFVYSIKRQFDPATRAQGSWLWQGRIVGLDEWKANGSDYGKEVPGLRALDERTLQIQLITPFPQLTHTLAEGYSAVVPEEAVRLYGQEFGVHPVGSGPYRLLSFDSARAVLVRNGRFREEPFSLAAEGYDPATACARHNGHVDVEGDSRAERHRARRCIRAATRRRVRDDVDRPRRELLCGRGRDEQGAEGGRGEGRGPGPR